MFSFIISCNLMEVNRLPSSTVHHCQCVAFTWNRIQVMPKFPLFFNICNIHTIHFLQCFRLDSGNNFHLTLFVLQFHHILWFWKICKDLIPLFHFYIFTKPTFPRTSLFLCAPDTHTPTKITTTQLRPACPPSRPPPWAARAQGFPRVSGWGLDNPFLVRTVITEGHLSMLFPFRQWEKQATGEMQKPPGNPDAPST